MATINSCRYGKKTKDWAIRSEISYSNKIIYLFVLPQEKIMGSKRLSDKEEKQLVQEYIDGMSVSDLCLKYGFKSKKSILDKVRKHCDNPQKIIEQAKQNRKGWHYSIEAIQSRFDAYFIGLMMTDGYITDAGKVGIDLIDEDCIAFLAKTIGAGYKTYEDSGLAFEKYERQPRHRLILSDKKLCEQLSRYGIVPRKTETLKGFRLQKEEQPFIPYLIRGIIDGDGCIFDTSYGGAGFYIISKSEDFIDWCKELLENHMYLQHLSKRKTTENLYRLETAAQTDILKLIVLSYDRPYGMERKYIHLRKTFRDYNKDPLLEE